MKRHIAMACLCMILGGISRVGAQEVDELSARVEELNRRIQQTVRALRATPHAETQRIAAERARAKREAREAALPGVPELESEIAEAIERVRELRTARSERVRRHAAELETLDEVVRAAEEAHALATVRAPAVTALVVERNRLYERLNELQGQPAIPMRSSE
jgi:outer membrane murein-binding lipoprotein Lpp